MAGDAVIAITPGLGENVSTIAIDNLNGGAVAEQDVQRIVLAIRTGISSIEDVDAGSPFSVTVENAVDVNILDTDPVEVRGNTSIYRPVITGSTSPAYSINDVVGGEIQLTTFTRNLGGLVLNSVSMWSDDALTPELDIMFFDTDLTGGTYTDNGALTLSATDKAKFLGRVLISTTDWRTIANDTWCTVSGLGIPMKGNGVNDLRMVIVTKTAFTLTATSALSMVLGTLRD